MDLSLVAIDYLQVIKHSRVHQG